MSSDWEWLNCDSRGEEERYERILRLSSPDRKACRSALGKVVHVVHTHVKTKGIAIDHVKTCGSVGKRTASSKSSDLDLVIFIAGLEPEDISKKSARILNEIQSALDRQYPDTRDVEWYRKFGLRYVIAGMEIDILIAAKGVQPKDFLNVDDLEQRAYMSASVSHYSTKFIVNQGPFFSDMVRVVKDWRDSYPGWPTQCKPKSYLLEILLLHAFRQRFPEHYNKDRNQVHYNFYGRRKRPQELLLHFFEMIANIKPYTPGKVYTKDSVSLCATFDTYYREEDIPWNEPTPLLQLRRTVGKGKRVRTKTRHATALVLDPANPTNNLWLTLADSNPLINRAKSTADMLRE